MDIPSKLYIQDIIKDDLDDDFIEGIISLIDEKCSQAYLLRSPLNEKKYNYYYDQDDENPDLYNNGFVFYNQDIPLYLFLLMMMRMLYIIMVNNSF